MRVITFSWASAQHSRGRDSLQTLFQDTGTNGCLMHQSIKGYGVAWHGRALLFISCRGAHKCAQHFGNGEIEIVITVTFHQFTVQTKPSRAERKICCGRNEKTWNTSRPIVLDNHLVQWTTIMATS